MKLPPHLLLAPTYATALKFLHTELGGPWKKVKMVNRVWTVMSADDVRAIRYGYPESLSVFKDIGFGVLDIWSKAVFGVWIGAYALGKTDPMFAF